MAEAGAPLQKRTTRPKAWGAPFARWERAWTTGEARVAAAVVMMEVSALVVWVSLKGLSSASVGGNAGGTVFREALMALALGALAYGFSRRKTEPARTIIVSVSVLVGVLAGRAWSHAAFDARVVAYVSNVLNWMQNASFLFLLGGLRGLVTRLTLLLTVLGASMATAQGKHINVDVVMRFLSPRARVPVAVIGWLAAAAVSFAATWGFIDYVAIASFQIPKDVPCEVNGAPSLCETTPSQKFGLMAEHLRQDAFLAGRQLTLDWKTLPHVARGERFDQYLRASEWNAWMREANWERHFEPQKVAYLSMDEATEESRIPAVVEPGGEARDLLVKEANLVFPLGLFVIGLRFLLRALLALSGHVEVDPDAAHADEEIEKRHRPEGGRSGEEEQGGARATESGPRTRTWRGLSLVLGVVLVAGLASGSVAVAVVVALALMGAPLFAVMGGASELAWLLHPQYEKLRFIAPEIFSERFSDSPILVTIPLFTFVGYLLAESKTPERLVRASTALFGWMPGGLAIVCIVASAVFTVFTGGSGVTIIAVGGLLYPALRREGYSERFSLGVVTTGGSLGLLLPYSLPLLVYSLVARVDYNLAFKAVLLPGLLVLVVLSAYAAWVGVREGVPRRTVSLGEATRAVWAFKWELGIAGLLVVGLQSGLTAIDEIAGVVALYTLLFECFVTRDLSLRKDLVPIAKASMSLAGAVILILAMANALINYVITEQIPGRVLGFMLQAGLDETWQFLLVMNVFLLVLGMVMDGFSAILVAVPLILPFAAHFALGPFHVAIICILNLELAFCCPPLGLNLFISSFRFGRPVVSLYRIVMPFVGLLTLALLVISYVPSLTNKLIEPDILRARALAEKEGAAPREAWKLECVQADPSNPLPCTEEDRKRYPGGQVVAVTHAKEVEMHEDGGNEADDLFRAMMGEPAEGGASTPSTDGGSAESADELFERMMNAGGEGAPKRAVDAPSADELFERMMQAGRDAGGSDEAR